MRNYKLEKLQNGETFITSEKGNSMIPLIYSGQNHKLSPCTWEDVQVGDIVYCKVNGSLAFNKLDSLVKIRNGLK